LPGIGEVTGDLGTNTLVVSYDPSEVTTEAIIQAVEDTGFMVEGQFEP
jgi:copper chaperone CopZ